MTSPPDGSFIFQCQFVDPLIKEDILTLGSDGVSFGILTRPVGQSKAAPVFIVLNSGMLHRVGPNRLNVKTARALAKEGYTSFRFDFSGIGDSGIVRNKRSFQENAIAELLSVMDQLSAKLISTEFVLCGLCTGAEITVFGALMDRRIVGFCGLNGIYPDPGDPYKGPLDLRITMRYYMKNVLKPVKWMKLMKRVGSFLRTISWRSAIDKALAGFERIKSRQSNNSGNSDVKKDIESDYSRFNNAFGLSKYWETLMQRDVPALLVYAEGSRSWDYYHYMRKMKTGVAKYDTRITVKLFRDVDHSFTPLWSHDELVLTICKWMKAQFPC